MTESKSFLFTGGLAETRNKLIAEQANSLEVLEDAAVISGNIRTADALSDSVSKRGSLNHYGAVTAITAADASSPYLCARRYRGNAVLPTKIRLPIYTGSSATGAVMEAFVYASGNIYASTNIITLAASIASTLEFTIDGLEYHLPALWNAANVEVRFLASGADLPVNRWSSDGIRFETITNYDVNTTPFYNTYFATAKDEDSNKFYTNNPINMEFDHNITNNINDSLTYNNHWIIAGTYNAWVFASQSGAQLAQDLVVEGTVPKLAVTNLNDTSHLLSGSTTANVIMYSSTNGAVWLTTNPARFTFLNTPDVSAASGLIKPDFMVEFKNKMYFGAPTLTWTDSSGGKSETYRRSLYPSLGFDAYTLDLNDEILLDTPEDLKGAVEYKDNLFVFTPNDVFYLTEYQDGTLAPIRKLSHTSGTRNSRSVVVANDALLWGNELGAFVSDGLTVKKISGSIDRIWQDIGLAPQAVIVDEDFGEVWFSFYDFASAVDLSLVYHYTSNAWTKHNRAIAAIYRNRQLTPRRNEYLTVTGEITHRYWDTENTTIPIFPPELETVYGYSGIADIKKECLILPDYSKAAEAVYLRVLTKGTYESSQGFKVTTFWDGLPSTNITEKTFWLTQQEYPYGDIIQTHKMLTLGQGNILHVNIEKSPSIHGEKPIDVTGVEVIDYQIIERRDL